ncbi:MAG: biotin--[acetyl-CoA-carboxylase] ligase [Terrimicrobiaceae bacterium]|nr:biotin--[acetyl-CoA-carboxylase] ligase [Terrimicrobiaceae bacterium]
MADEIALLDRDRIATAGGFWRVTVFRETESTNDIVLRAAEGGEPEGFAVFAESQTRGRGQFGRRWDSSPGRGLWFSFLLRPRWPIAQLAQMTPLIAVAAARALAAHTNLAVRIKPPNDIHCSGRKLAGILSEARTGREAFVAVGIGINVNHSTRDFPLELQASATSLAIETGRSWEREAVATAMLSEVARVYDPGGAPGAEIREAYAALSHAPVCDNFPP